jgi:Ni,Fe-hydrogenase III component G
MSEETIIHDLERAELPQQARTLCEEGFRLVQMMGTPREDSIEVMVSFDKNYELRNFRIFVPRDELTLPSITDSFLAAFTYENELQDLFGIKVENLAIDYEGHFLRTRMPHPMAEMVDPKVASKKPATKRSKPVAEAEKQGKTIKTIGLSGVQCETAPDIDNPKPDSSN